MGENNKIIAEFMGMKIVNRYLQKYIDSNTEPKQYWEGKSKTFEHQIFGWQITHHESKILYHSDWNWLMEVVEKIESLGSAVSINNKECMIVHFNNITGKEDKDFLQTFTLGDTKIEVVYNACVKFINFYNKQKEK